MSVKVYRGIVVGLDEDDIKKTLAEFRKDEQGTVRKLLKRIQTRDFLDGTSVYYPAAQMTYDGPTFGQWWSDDRTTAHGYGNTDYLVDSYGLGRIGMVIEAELDDALATKAKAEGLRLGYTSEAPYKIEAGDAITLTAIEVQIPAGATARHNTSSGPFRRFDLGGMRITASTTEPWNVRPEDMPMGVPERVTVRRNGPVGSGVVNVSLLPTWQGKLTERDDLHTFEVARSAIVGIGHPNEGEVFVKVAGRKVAELLPQGMYHGTVHDVAIGAELRAGIVPGNYDNQGKLAAQVVWMTDDPEDAFYWALQAAHEQGVGEDKVRVYLVDPVGNVRKWKGPMGANHYTAESATVLGRVENYRWGHGEIKTAGAPTKLYHAAPKSARDSIAQNGLDWHIGNPNGSAPHGNFFHVTRAAIDDMMSDGLAETHDLYEVNVKGLGATFEVDPYQDDAIYTDQVIPPSRVKRLGSIRTAAGAGTKVQRVPVSLSATARVTKVASNSLWWRGHPDNRPFSVEDATSTTWNGRVSSVGYSCYANPWHLLMHFDAARMYGAIHQVIAFSGTRVGTGADGEDLAMPDMNVVRRMSVEELQDEALKLPLPPTPLAPGVQYSGFGSWTQAKEHYRREGFSEGDDPIVDRIFKAGAKVAYRPDQIEVTVYPSGDPNFQAVDVGAKNDPSHHNVDAFLCLRSYSADHKRFFVTDVTIRDLTDRYAGGHGTSMALAFHERFPTATIVHGKFTTAAGRGWATKMVREYPSWNEIDEQFATMPKSTTARLQATARMWFQATLPEERYGTKANVKGQLSSNCSMVYNRDTDTLSFASDQWGVVHDVSYIPGGSMAYNGARVEIIDGEIYPAEGSGGTLAPTLFNPLIIEAVERLADTFPEVGRWRIHENPRSKYNNGGPSYTVWDYLRSINSMRAQAKVAKVSISDYFADGVTDLVDTPWRLDDVHIAMDPYTWKSMPVEEISIVGLHPTQKYLTQKYIDQRGDEQADLFDLPWIVEYKGERWVLDGHHRIAKALQQGKTTMAVHIMRPGAPSPKTAAWGNGLTLYHGTIGYYADKILAEGLSPRTETGITNHWSDKAISHSGLVYLSHSSRLTVSRLAMGAARKVAIKALWPQIESMTTEMNRLRPDSYSGRESTPEYEKLKRDVAMMNFEVSNDARLESVILAVRLPFDALANLRPDEDTDTYSTKVNEMTGMPEWMASLGSDAVVAYQGTCPPSWITVQARGRAADQAGMYSDEGRDWAKAAKRATTAGVVLRGPLVTHGARAIAR